MVVFMSKSPFDYLKAINTTKQYNLEPEDEKKYPSFVINRGLSYHVDTVLYANQMNMNHHLDAKIQYDYLFYSIKRKNRFTKWLKKDFDENLGIVMRYYKYNASKAKAILPILTDEQIKTLKEKLDPGGTVNDRDLY